MEIEARVGELHISDGEYELCMRYDNQTGELTVCIGQSRGAAGICFFADFDTVAGWIEMQKEEAKDAQASSQQDRSLHNI